MKQMAIRTHKSESYSNLKSLNKYLDEGWCVLFINPIGEFLEYILQKNDEINGNNN